MFIIIVIIITSISIIVLLVRLIDLLISTECWLSLYADWNAFDGASERPPFRTVRRVQVRLRAWERCNASRVAHYSTSRVPVLGLMFIIVRSHRSWAQRTGTLLVRQKGWLARRQTNKYIISKEDRRTQVRLRAPHGRAAEPSALAAQELLVAGPMVTRRHTHKHMI